MQYTTNFHGDIIFEILSYIYGSAEEKSMDKNVNCICTVNSKGLF